MKRYISWIVSTMIVMCLMNGYAVTVFAGDINAAEASVISAASGTFEYNGATYRAYPDYVSELSAYFAKDDVNLSEAEAQDLISSIHANVADGVSLGYIYKVSDGDGSEDNASKDRNEQTQQKDEASKKDAKKKKYEIKKAIENNKIFYIDEESKQTASIEMVIKNTGFSIVNSIYVMIGLMIIMVGSIVVAFRLRLFAHDDES